MAAPNPTQPSVELMMLVHQRAGCPADPETDLEAAAYLIVMHDAAVAVQAELVQYLATITRLAEKTRATLADPEPSEPDPAPTDAVPEPPIEAAPDPELCPCGCRRPLVQSGNRRRIWATGDACRKRGVGGWRGPLPPDAIPYPPGVIHTLGISTAAAAA